MNIITFQPLITQTQKIQQFTSLHGKVEYNRI